MELSVHKAEGKVNNGEKDVGRFIGLSSSKYVRGILRVLEKYKEVDSISELCEKMAKIEDVPVPKIHYHRVHKSLKLIIEKTSLVECVGSKIGGNRVRVRLKK